MRSFVVAASFLFLAAGCTAPASPGTDDPGPAGGDAPPGVELAAEGPPAEDPVRDSLTLEGRYRAVKPFGEPIREDGNTLALDVGGWKQVVVALDSSIEIDLLLLPPGCASVADPCAIRFSPPEDETDGTWELPSLGRGSWTVAVQADEDVYSFVDGVYAVTFDYVLA